MALDPHSLDCVLLCLIDRPGLARDPHERSHKTADLLISPFAIGCEIVLSPPFTFYLLAPASLVVTENSVRAENAEVLIIREILVVSR